MDDARQKLKDLGDRIEAAMERHGITQAEICIRRFRWRMIARFGAMTHQFKQVADAADEACLAARELSKALPRIKRR